MSAADRIAAALDHLGGRTGCEVAKVHALLAIAEAILETRQPPDTPQAAPHAAQAPRDADPAPQDQPAHDTRLDVPRCNTAICGVQCLLPLGHEWDHHQIRDGDRIAEWRDVSKYGGWITAGAPYRSPYAGMCYDPDKKRWML